MSQAASVLDNMLQPSHKGVFTTQSTCHKCGSSCVATRSYKNWLNRNLGCHLGPPLCPWLQQKCL